LNGVKSRLTDLNDPETKPDGWDEDQPPALKSLQDLSIWELHVRDFSVNDVTVAPEQRGTYLAFTNPETDGMRHLRSLAQAGINAVHLLPTFHFASVNDDKANWKTAGDLTGYRADGSEQQEAVSAIKDHDGYNWGYDPVHYMTPEGSYALDAGKRVKEYRAMVRALHSVGLRVIQDQVFNHTSASGQAANSVLDKIVPDYYYRLDADGRVMNATCCSDTASERRMMEKLMVDAVKHSVQHYKIDGFRFDLMGFHFVSNMRKIQEAVGAGVYVYGEGWPCEETANRPGMPNATQGNLTGTGIGTFNDGIRDAIRGGHPFADVRLQGFATGAPSDEASGSKIRAGLCGAPGYTASPIECVNYCSAHDNQTLFDAIQLKSPEGEDATIRTKRQILALSMVALAQGIPFFHAGDEMLRSKGMDGNSYNSGDWFNRLDFSYQSNNWGIGLPIASENEVNWPVMQPLLANPLLNPSTEDIARTRNAFEALLRVRYSSGLFRMRTAEEVRRNLRFVKSEPGVIAMVLRANVGRFEGHQRVLVVFNGKVAATTVNGPRMKPHPEMPGCGTYDAGVFNVDGLSTGVFVD
jgi:pullulanase